MSELNIREKIQELRQRTGAAILDCKKALDATENDIEKAVEWLKEQGIAKAAKKGGAIAAEGVVAINENDDSVVLYEINSQTDFVAGNDKFIALVKNIGQILLNNEFDNIDQALLLPNEDGESISDLTLNATAIIGEKIMLRRALKVKKVEDEVIGAYVHNNHRVAAIVITVGGTYEVARNVAMHVASMNPEYLDVDSVPQTKITEINTEIYNLPLLANKPDQIRENIAQGMISKKLAEITLVDQEFIMEKIKVKDYLAKHKARAIAMYRYEVAEGITKKVEDFAAEVAAQMETNGNED